jgi:hypothetical protein
VFGLAGLELSDESGTLLVALPERQESAERVDGTRHRNITGKAARIFSKSERASLLDARSRNGMYAAIHYLIPYCCWHNLVVMLKTTFHAKEDQSFEDYTLILSHYPEMLGVASWLLAHSR